ncbi:hypothetical protein [Polymorphobacter fuscus]|uniref:Uncharacterized protein n=1 Tax=Sandarakinorhabdus fusca TaxID=1439888 RepID=A0A7C9GNF3_9SPHN|nr:hypothetical protein [Polymorphobacter fuscus]KAB7648624.1 hypothetical protein F9290_02740 [Polymorphobacter fuscus]MQT16176.1 hypothetical protein [Polymorphobacter fuscus]NJC07541.1 hypothetical protein [Polymorphobacter fuscus]
MDWADAQFLDARQYIISYIENKQCGYREEIDEHGHRIVLFANRLPKEFPLLIGSGVHALRSALDTAVSTLVQGVSKRLSDSVNFPFRGTETELRKDFSPIIHNCNGCGKTHTGRVKFKDLARYLPDFQELLFNEFKPWKEGNYNLWALNQLDNIQKHRALLQVATTTTAAFNYSTPEGVSSRGGQWQIGAGFPPMEIARSRSRIIYGEPPSINCQAIMPADVPFAGADVFETIGTLYREVRGVLLKLHTHYEGHPALSP